LKGTYSVAVLASFHKIPFHTVAPTSTVDFECASGNEIPIEERSKAEVHGYGAVRWAPANAKTFNPAFDVTPVELLESIILDSGVYTKDAIQKGCLKDLKKK
jgi:methylthioribose-1-phosphate isomerase